MKTLQYANSSHKVAPDNFKHLITDAVDEVNQELIAETDLLKTAFQQVVGGVWGAV